ncbi:hypothetical protein TBR22_A41910 [Luteitalea sp. TBR-22]|uniref:helix-turn-helix transcriptional regulator n=1 Tax=Luteitalea sp. TBR-22 TaxID=2802971 RepID=UPI001AF708DB|nr:helix-turn-helix transcriptional regulator [Luteitalea sp. TBR-22]BCS34965.1 hypothetical protein TBR22_A41910 [Luteitalea sp. TBR-22]
MRLRSVTLTPERLALCRPLWGGRSFHTDDEFEAMVRTAADLLASRHARGSLVLDETGAARFFGFTLFARTSAVDQVFAGPPEGIARTFLSEAGRGDVLDLSGIGRGNAGNGLDLVVCAQGYELADASDTEFAVVVGTLLQNFFDIHRGFRLRRIVGVAFGTLGAHIVQRSGAYPDVRVWSGTTPGGTPAASAMFSLTHAQATNGYSALLPMFTYFPPRVQFTEPEQDVLREALEGATDALIAARLGLSVAAVKSRLTRAYERVQVRLPGLLPVRDVDDMARGSQVRHVVLDFVRSNPSELTPYERSSTMDEGLRRFATRTATASERGRGAPGIF